MVGAVSSLSMYYTAPNAARYTGRHQAGQAQEAQRAGGVWTARRAASPETPVEPVRPVSTVKGEEAKPVALSLPTLREGADPAEMAVRMRMTPYEEDPAADQAFTLQADMSLEIHTILCAMAHNSLLNYAFAITKAPLRQLMLQNVTRRMRTLETSLLWLRRYAQLHDHIRDRDLEGSLTCLKGLMNSQLDQG